MELNEFDLNLGEPEAKKDGKKSEKKAPKKLYTIFVDEEEHCPNFIPVSINGRAYQIQRGVDVPNIPEEVIEVLRNAVASRLVQTTDPVTGLINTREQSFHRIPWRIVG